MPTTNFLAHRFTMPGPGRAGSGSCVSSRPALPACTSSHQGPAGVWAAGRCCLQRGDGAGQPSASELATTSSHMLRHQTGPQGCDGHHSSVMRCISAFVCNAHRELQRSGLHPFIRLMVTLVFPCPVLWHLCHLFIANILVFEVWNVDYTSSMACRWEKIGKFHPQYCRKEQEQLWTYHRAGQGAEPHTCTCTLILPLLKNNKKIQADSRRKL